MRGDTGDPLVARPHVEVARIAMWIGRLAGLVVIISLAAALAYSFGTLVIRPLDGVEGEVLHEANRLRGSLALYTDPIAGALDEGPVPSRFFVLYPPLWAGILSLASYRSAAIVGRSVACAAWFGLLAAIILRSPRERRRDTAMAAAFVGGVYTLALFASAARPDALAVAFAGIGLVRAVERRGVDAVCGALFALGVWTKPNVFGIAVGAMAASVWIDRRAARRALAGALVVSAFVAGILQVTSGGAWLGHLVRSTAQPMNASTWMDQALWRSQCVGAPLLLALLAAWRARASDAVRIAFGALAGSLAWTLVSLAKIGAASNYWMEPAVAAVVVVSQAPVGLPARPAAALTFAGCALLQSLWTGVATVRSSVEAIVAARVHADLIARARTACGARAGEIVLADEPGLELMLNRRVVTTPFQMTHLAWSGRYPLEPWIADVERPDVRCLVMEDDLLERPLDDVRVAHDRFPVELRRALRARFVLLVEQGGWRLYRAREPPDTSEPAGSQ